MRCLLIDLGSTFIKYGIYDAVSGNIITDGKTSFPEPSLNNGKIFRVPVDEIKEKILDIFSETQKFSCKKAFISVQMHGYIIKNFDGSFTEYVSWRDQSGDITAAELQQIDFQNMGTSLRPNLPLAKLPFGKREGEFFTLGSYVAWILTGRNATHITDACPSGFYYADTGACNEYTGNMIMPKAYMNVTALGTYNRITVYTPVGDHQISFLGSGAGEEQYLANIGTATQLSCVADGDAAEGPFEKRPYFESGKRLYTINGLIGGDILFQGEKRKELLSQILDAVKKLPSKKEVLVGGGGAILIYDYLKEKLGEHDIACSLSEKNIGLEGLKIIAQEHKIKVGTMFSELNFPNFPVIAKNSELDFMIIDNEHGAFDYSVMSGLLVNANLVKLDAIVRIGSSSRETITKLADLGAKGFLLPMTNCKEDIEQVVKYAKYVPIGERGVSTTRVHTFYNPPPLEDYMISANEAMKIYAQIETKSGVENVDGILAVNGVDGVLIGPNDLSVSLGCLSDKTLIFDCIRKIAEAARRAGKVWGIITKDQELLAYSQECNVDMISYGSELNMLISGCKKIKEMFCIL